MVAAVKSLFTKTNGLSFVAGLILVFAYAPYSHWWLPLIILPMFLALIDGKSIKHATQACFSFGLGWFSAGISWVHVSIDQFGGMPLVVSLLLMLLLCLYLALYPMLAGYLASKLSATKTLHLGLFVSTWLVCEYLRSIVLTGFPWLSLGYSQIDSPLAVLAPVIGEIGITAYLLALSYILVRVIRSSNKLPWAVSLIVFSVCLISASALQWVKPTGNSVKVALAQGNIAQSIKWDDEQEWPTMLMYLDMARANYDADIIVWPESAIPTLEPMAQDYLDLVNQSAGMNDSAIITGILDYNFETKSYYNALITLGNSQTESKTTGDYFYNHSNRFYKHHLLPIGEFVPFGDLLRPLAPFFNLPMSSFSRGDYVQQNLKAKGIDILPLICFEIAFPNQLAANFTNQTQLLLTVSNDAWFGTSHGPHQHMEIARMRALEFGRPLVRSTNTGVTAAVDHQGQFIDKLPQFEQAVLKTEVALVQGFTPYSRLGNVPVFIVALLSFIAISLTQRKR
ncbi:apolipoprotein N-acyltransferase [Thalassotalea sp. LPB0316]|uniref:apolipoprotein N-acyltransferase n=1 Tax=Thalassotalea sp. LPB0316 TaxID=2769490 RepID=UPI001866EDE6|nr:apolipoprotein N-acyltransferase [Thalassotalea sp. LPB0316]QOL24502.1 apolipoprotein N-acyltransferase [Thalassotalea sp. LPB0316]